MPSENDHGEKAGRLYGSGEIRMRFLPGLIELGISCCLMNPRHSFALVLLVLTGWVGGCGQKQGRGYSLPEPPKVADCQPGIPGGRVVLAIGAAPRTFNPIAAGDEGSEAVTRLLFSSLVGLNMESQEAVPGLAESWSVGADQKTWTFKLRKNLRWSDGEPLTADDVVFTWNEIMYNPKYNEGTYDLFRADGKNFEVSKVDEVTVRVVTPEKWAPFLEYFGSVAILPKHTLERFAATGDFLKAYAVADAPEKIVGSGPFRLKVVQSGSLLLERNPEYWIVDKQGRRLPYFDEVQLVIAPPILAFAQGVSSACENLRPEEVRQFQQASTNGNFRVVDVGVGVQRDFFWFNQNTGVDKGGKAFVDPVKLKWFRDKRFRQAISCAINRERIVKEVYGDRAQAVSVFLSADNKKWNNPSVPQYSYNPDKARALLAELGMTGRTADGTLQDAEGHPVEFTMISTFDNPVRNGTAARLEEDLRQLGIRLNYKAVDFATLRRRIDATMDYESALMGFGGGGFDPASQMNVLRSDAPLHQWFPMQRKPSTDWEAKIDGLMDDQMQTLDFQRRKKDFDEVQAIWAEELPMISIAAPAAAAAVRSNIGNVRPVVASAYHVTWNIEELYFKGGEAPQHK